jgi:hypothetical protein
MVEGISEEELYKRQFIGFILLLANSAMQQLGKQMNPTTGKVERSLQGAKATIDMIKMLQVKTRGNLSKEEQQVLDSSLANVQLNYVDELKRKDQPAADKAAPGTPPADTASKDKQDKPKGQRTEDA